ncbi:hypothetical protein [Streptomyces sp. NPDC058678]
MQPDANVVNGRGLLHPGAAPLTEFNDWVLMSCNYARISFTCVWTAPLVRRLMGPSKGLGHLGGYVGDQLSTLIAVTLGAVLSFLVGTLNERTRWRREQGARWDGLLLQAYSDYGQAVKECVVAYQRLAAHQGLTQDPTPLEPTDDALEQAAKAESRRSAMTEPLRLLADPATAAAVRKLNEAV